MLQVQSINHLYLDLKALENRYIYMELIFNWCVDVLIFLANVLGITYQEINVWVFCIIEPIVFIYMLTLIIKQNRYIKRIIN